MAYSRFGQADVYVFMSVVGTLSCFNCSLQGSPEPFMARSTPAMVRHLEEHQRRGDDVPEDLTVRLWEDDYKNFPQN